MIWSDDVRHIRASQLSASNFYCVCFIFWGSGIMSSGCRIYVIIDACAV